MVECRSSWLVCGLATDVIRSGFHLVALDLALTLMKLRLNTFFCHLNMAIMVQVTAALALTVVGWRSSC